jgi:hypothetical protein
MCCNYGTVYLKEQILVRGFFNIYYYVFVKNIEIKRTSLGVTNYLQNEISIKINEIDNMSTFNFHAKQLAIRIKLNRFSRIYTKYKWIFNEFIELSNIKNKEEYKNSFMAKTNSTYDNFILFILIELFRGHESYL